jgi:hypothetical protein
MASNAAVNFYCSNDFFMGFPRRKSFHNLFDPGMLAKRPVAGVTCSMSIQQATKQRLSGKKAMSSEQEREKNLQPS